jgi:hypothetical protein
MTHTIWETRRETVSEEERQVERFTRREREPERQRRIRRKAVDAATLAALWIALA